MKFSNVRLLVKDFATCFKFYTEQLGLKLAWGDENSGYVSFKVAAGIEGFALFVSDWMGPAPACNICTSISSNKYKICSVFVEIKKLTDRLLSNKGIIFAI